MSTFENPRPSVAPSALAFAARGWPVFPCHPETKQPLVKGDKDGAGELIPNSGGVKKASRLIQSDCRV